VDGLIGRAALIESLDIVTQQASAVCLCGPPGIGKSSIARQWARGHGAAWCSLGDVEDLDGLICAILIARGVLPGELPGGVQRERLDALLAQPAPLVIDQAEHLICDLWPMLARARGPILVTSRIAPRGAVIAVPPLSDDDMGALWLARCGRPLDPALRAVLDGNPLSLELAAARARFLPPHRLIDAHAADATLAASISRSWSLLDLATRRALARLSALPHTIDLDLAERVAGGLDVIMRLGDASLLSADPDAATLRVPASIRAFARSAAPDAVLDGEAMCASWLLEVAHMWPEHLDDAPDRLAWIARHLPALELLMQRGETCVEAALCAAVVAARLLSERGPVSPLLARLAALTAAPSPSRWYVEALLTAARLLSREGKNAQAAEALERARRAVDAPLLDLRALHAHAVTSQEAGAHDAALASLSAILAHEAAPQAPNTVAHAMLRLAQRQGERLGELAGRAQALFQAQGDLYGECLARSYVAEHERAQGRVSAAQLELEHARALSQRLGSPTLDAYLLLSLSRLLREAAPREAAAHLASAVARYEEAGNHRGACVAAIDEANLLRESGGLDESWAALARAERLAALLGLPHLMRAVSASRGLWELGCGAARPAEAAACLESAQHRAAAMERARPLDAEEPYTRRWRRRLCEALAAQTGALRVRVAHDGAWVEPPGQPAAPLAHRPALRAIVAALATAEAPLTLDALWACGWPGERASAESQRNRVHVALATLRKLGLQDALVFDASGWRFDMAQVSVV
jgi:hypothetical protein